MKRGASARGLEHWHILYLDGIHFSIRHGDQADATIILTALGVDLDGNKEVLARLSVCRGKQGGMGLPPTPYRVLCNGVKRECVKTTPVLASRLFCNSALHKIRYGVQLASLGIPHEDIAKLTDEDTDRIAEPLAHTYPDFDERVRINVVLYFAS